MASATRQLKTRRQFLAASRDLGLAVLGGSLLAACSSPSAAGSHIYRLGIVYVNGTVASKNAFLGQLRKLGYVEGQNILVEMRDAGGNADRLPALFAEVIAWGADVIYASGTQTAIAAKLATVRSHVPVVALMADPVGTGIVNNLARPGGNLTGVSLFANQLAAKRAQLLNEVMPDLERVGVLYQPDDPSRVSEFVATVAAGNVFGWETLPIEIRFKEEIPDAFEHMLSIGIQAIIVPTDPLTLTSAGPITSLALDYRMPGMYGDVRFASLGGLMGYSASSLEQQAKAADYVHRIFHGAKPADLAIQQPARFEFIVNIKTANVLGMRLPPSVIERATDLIA